MQQDDVQYLPQNQFRLLYLLHQKDWANFQGKITEHQIKLFNSVELIKVLNDRQLRQRSWKRFVVYTVGVLTLGIVCSAVALFVYLNLFTYAIRYHDREGVDGLFRKLNANPYRMYRFFKEYVFPTTWDCEA